MTQITIPDVDDRVVLQLKHIAWKRGLPLDEALRRLLEEASACAPSDRRHREIAQFEPCTD